MGDENMLSIVKTTITREKLREGNFLPENMVLLKEEPLDSDKCRKFYHPAVELLSKMYKEQ
jgi:hypothetical protein